MTKEHYNIAIAKKIKNQFTPGLINYVYQNIDNLPTFRVDVGHLWTNRNRYVCTYLCVRWNGKNVPIVFEGDDTSVIRRDWKKVVKNYKFTNKS